MSLQIASRCSLHSGGARKSDRFTERRDRWRGLRFLLLPPSHHSTMRRIPFGVCQTDQRITAISVSECMQRSDAEAEHRAALPLALIHPNGVLFSIAAGAGAANQHTAKERHEGRVRGRHSTRRRCRVRWIRSSAALLL